MTKQEKASGAGSDLESPTFRTQLAVFLSLAVFTTGQSFLLVVLPPMGRRLGFSDIHIAGILSLAAWHPRGVISASVSGAARSC